MKWQTLNMLLIVDRLGNELAIECATLKTSTVGECVFAFQSACHGTPLEQWLTLAKKIGGTELTPLVIKEFRAGLESDLLHVDFDLKIGLMTLKENQTMLPRSNAPSAPVRTGSMNWLKTEMLSKQPKEAKILAVKAKDGKFGAQVILKLALDGQVVFDSVSVKNNPNYTALEQKFGHDENDWINAKVLVGLEQDEFSDQFFKRYSFPAEKSSKK